MKAVVGEIVEVGTGVRNSNPSYTCGSVIAVTGGDRVCSLHPGKQSVAAVVASVVPGYANEYAEGEGITP